MGKPVLDAAKKREIIAILTVGCSRTTAARYVGCHVATIRNTAERETEFAEQLLRAESTHEIALLKNINEAAGDMRYWRAAAWALERKSPDRYSARKPHAVTPEQISQALAQLAEILLEEIADEELRRQIMARVDALTAALLTGDPKEEIRAA